MNIKSITVTAIAALSALAGRAQTSADPRICWYGPEDATQDEEITVYFNATRGTAGLKGYTGDVYAHAGVITQESSNTTDWKHAPSNWGDNDPKYLMTRSATDPDIYTLTMTPSKYFNLYKGERIRSLAFVMRDRGGSRVGKDTGDADIIVPFLNQTVVVGDGNLGAYQSYTADGSTATVKARNGQLTLTFYNDHVVKVFTLPEGETAAERPSITVCAQPEGEFSVTDGDEALVFATSGMQVRVAKSTCAVTFADASGKARLSELGGLDNSGPTRTVSFAGMNDLAFYGGGYNGQTINHNNNILVMNNTQTGNWTEWTPAPHNICIPFYVSTSGYGVLFDDHYRYAEMRPSATGSTYTTNSLNPIAYYYVGGDGSMASVMENYTFLTGRQELPPYWALGYITSRYGYQSRQEAEDVVRRIKSVNLPLDGIVMDLYWQGESPAGMGNLDWNSRRWQNPQEMMANFDAQGVKTVLITEPFFTSNSSNYTSLRNAGYLADDDVSNMSWLQSGSVGLIDASNPEAMDWMWGFYKARTREGVGGWWLDLGEPEQHDGDSRHQGGSVEQVHNEFGNLWVERVYRGLKEEFPDMRPFIMPRAGTSGMQRFATFPWTGDIQRSWGGLAAQVPALVSASMSGVGYMGSDVGGFSAGGTDAALYLRWVEMATFSPMMRTHSTVEPEPYNSCYSGVLDDVRSFINMRYSYLPYTYTLAYENTVKGTPLARPVNFYTPANSELANCRDEYLWGRDILVAPVLSSASSRQVVLPEGQWVDLNDMGKVYEGNTTINYDAPLGTLPHFGRKGSIIPRYTQDAYTSTGDIDETALTLTYLTGTDDNEPVSASVFADNRLSPTSIEDGEYLLTAISGTHSSDGHHISFSASGNGYSGMPEERTVTVVMPGFTDPVHHVSSSAVKDSFVQMPSKQAFDATSDPAYYMDHEAKTLHVKSVVPTMEPSDIFIAHTASAISPTEADREGIAIEFSTVTGTFTYTLAASMTDAAIRVHDLTGMEADIIGPLTADGTARQATLTRRLAPGFYLATLNATAAGGATLTSTIKIAVR